MKVDCNDILGRKTKTHNKWHRVKLKSQKNILVLIDETQNEDLTINVFIDGKTSMQYLKGLKLNLAPLEPINLKIKEKFNED